SGSWRVSDQFPSPLPPVWQVLCQLNPHYGTGEYEAHRAKLETLVGNPPAPLCVDHLDENTSLNEKERPNILSVIASVPDPLHTHLVLWLDREIEALQVAAGELSYIPHSHYLPWVTPESGGSPPGASETEMGRAHV